MASTHTAATAIARPALVPVPRFDDPRGSLIALERARPLPFEPRRVYCLFDVPPGERRGGHAHRLEQELLIALRGALSVRVEDAQGEHRFHLSRPDQALWLPPWAWHELDDFTPGALLLVLASRAYDPRDHLGELETFRRELRARTAR